MCVWQGQGGPGKAAAAAAAAGNVHPVRFRYRSLRKTAEGAFRSTTVGSFAYRTAFLFTFDKVRLRPIYPWLGNVCVCVYMCVLPFGVAKRSSFFLLSLPPRSFCCWQMFFHKCFFTSGSVLLRPFHPPTLPRSAPSSARCIKNAFPHFHCQRPLPPPPLLAVFPPQTYSLPFAGWLRLVALPLVYIHGRRIEHPLLSSPSLPSRLYATRVCPRYRTPLCAGQLTPELGVEFWCVCVFFFLKLSLLFAPEANRKRTEGS